MPRRLTDEETVPVMLAAGLQPLEPYPSAQKHWRCECLTCSNVVAPAYTDIRSGKTKGCKYCAPNTPINPEEAVTLMRAASLEPLEAFQSTKTAWLCRCVQCDREVTPTYGSIRSGQGGCGYCGGNVIEPADAEQMMRDAGVEPLEPYQNANTPWRCRCMTCGEVVTPRYGWIQNGNGGCKYCAGQVVESDDAEATMLAAGVRPMEPYPNSRSPWKCQCLTCGREVKPSYGHVRDGHQACAYCSGRKVHTADAEADAVAAGLRPLTSYPGDTKAPWRCECQTCGKEVVVTRNGIRKGSGCRYCAKRGFDYTAPGIVYLIVQQDLQAVKVGVTTEKSNNDRVADHQKHGWSVERTWGTPTGETAMDIEQDILDWWRDTLGAPEALTADDMPQGGFTETASLFHVDLDETTARIEEMVKALTAVQQPVCAAT